jgi:hypothetical protein
MSNLLAALARAKAAMKTTGLSGLSGLNDGKVNKTNQLAVAATPTTGEAQMVGLVGREALPTTCNQSENASGLTLIARESLLKQEVAKSPTTQTTNFKACPQISGSNEIIQQKPLPKAPSKPLKPPPPENIGPNYGGHWGANLEPDEAANLAKVRAEIQAGIKRNKTAQKRKPETLTPAAREMERETYRRLPEVRAAAGLPPVESGAPPLKAQGDYCANRGMGYLADFWAELTSDEKRHVGGKAALDAWKRTAREADEASKASPPPAPVPAVYLEALAQLQARKPLEVTEAQWKQAIEDAGRFLDEVLAAKAFELGWTARDLFDPPIMGVPPGLVWFLCGRPVASLGLWAASVGEGHIVWNKETRHVWQSPYVVNCDGMER